MARDTAGVPDAYTERFYAFERAARARFEPRRPPMLGLNTCARIVEQAFAWCDARPALPVIYSSGPGLKTGRCSCDGRFITIALPTMRRRPWCALHEATHALDIGGEHGPAFAQLCIDLWVAVARWPREELLMLAASHQVSLLYEEVVWPASP